MKERNTQKLYEIASALSLLVDSRIIAIEYAKSIISKYLVDEAFIEKKLVEKPAVKPDAN